MKRRTYEPKPLFVERMQELLGKDFDKYMKILKKEPVKSIRCNKLKISPEELKKRLKNWNIKQPFNNNPEIIIVEGKNIHRKKFAEDNRLNNKKDGYYINNNYQSASDSERVLINLQPGELGRTTEHLLGYYYIQELASMLPVIALEPKSDEFILDLCAAPGSKTTQIATQMKNTGVIIANDISLGRIKILASNLERCGVTNTIITRKEGYNFCKRLEKEGGVSVRGNLVPLKFDKILIDAPCSGEGTLRSDPKTFQMWNINSIKRLSKIQKNLVSSAIELLKLNGELVYSTCTHAPEENEEVVDFILKKFKDRIKIEEIKLPIKCRQGIIKWEDKNYDKSVTKSCRIYPQDNNTEGFFIAKFRRK